MIKKDETDVYTRKMVKVEDENYHDTGFTAQDIIYFAEMMEVDPKDLYFTVDVESDYYGNSMYPRVLYSYSRLETDKEYNERIKKHEEKMARKTAEIKRPSIKNVKKL